MQVVLYELHEKHPSLFSSNLRDVPSLGSCVSLGVWGAAGLFVENPEAQPQSPVSHEETGVVKPVANCWPRAGILQVQSCVALLSIQWQVSACCLQLTTISHTVLARHVMWPMMSRPLSWFIYTFNHFKA